VRALLGEASRHEFNLFVLEEDLPMFAFAAAAMTIVPVAERYRAAVKNIYWHQIHLPRLVRARALDVLHVPSLPPPALASSVRAGGHHS